ncbi:MAG: sulfurtransferase TusA family protein [Bacillota bacterium]
MLKVDTRGRSCPEPVIMTKNAVNDLNKGDSIKVLIGEEVAKENVGRFARNSGCNVEVNNKDNDEYELLITKK